MNEIDWLQECTHFQCSMEKFFYNGRKLHVDNILAERWKEFCP